MKEKYIDLISRQMGVARWQVSNCVDLLEEGDTIPFISRYRKEKTGRLDDVAIDEIQRLKGIYDALEKRKETVLSTISSQGKLTEELSAAIEDCSDSRVLEDLYLPYKPKRRTRAQIAREAGLEPLATGMLSKKVRHPLKEAEAYVNDKVPDVEAVLAGARDIIAETFNENASARAEMRGFMSKQRVISRPAKGAEDNPEAQNYRAYFNRQEELRRIPAHRLLAMLRGQEEGWLTLKLDVNTEKCREKLYFRHFGKSENPPYELSQQVRMAIQDCLDRLMVPSLSNDLFQEAKARADVESVRVFGENLRQLLLASPVGPKRVMAVDPGYRNGCKIVCLDEQGNLLHHEIIYPHPPQSEKVRSIAAVSRMMNEYDIQAIAIGNGTASRETEDFFKRIPMPDGCATFLVSEDGASIYSASDVAREEFPDQDVTVRGAVSIGRRLMDPLSELVKIDPKSLGVGQYQHDVDQKLLREELDNVVEQCVSSVGVNVNTASSYLLRYVAGIGPSLSLSIVSYRKDHGPFTSRGELLSVPRLGEKAFKQCAGFLRVEGGPNPLDNSAVHPEAYPLVEKMAAGLGVAPADLVANQPLLTELRSQIDRYVDDEFGKYTIGDILDELAKPGRDPRGQVRTFAFREDIHDLEDLAPGMEVPGIITNVTDFGAFVNIGVHKEGLINSKSFPSSLPRPKLSRHVLAKVTYVDVDRRRIGLELLEYLD